MAIEFKKKPGLVVYLTAGDPDLATTRDIALAAIDNGADVIELGVPFSDPLADGPVIQRASERAVAKGVRLTDVLGVAKELRAARPQAGLILFSYLNPVVRDGHEGFLCAGCGRWRGWRSADGHDRRRGRRVSRGDACEQACAGVSCGADLA